MESHSTLEMGDLADMAAMVEAQSRSGAEQTPIVLGDQTVRYGELDQASNRVANGLLSQGVGQGAPIGVVGVAGLRLVEIAIAIGKIGGTMIVPSRTASDDAVYGLLTAERVEAVFYGDWPGVWGGGGQRLKMILSAGPHYEAWCEFQSAGAVRAPVSEAKDPQRAAARLVALSEAVFA